MKKYLLWVALCLALLLQPAGTALSETERDGSARAWGAQPYPGLRVLDLNSELGYRFFFPDRDMKAHIYCDTLEIFVPRMDISLGDGALCLWMRPDSVEKYDAENWLKLCEISFADSENVRMRAMSAEECSAFLWQEGVCVGIRLPRSLEAERDYAVSMAQGCLTSADGRTENDAFTASDFYWRPGLSVDGEGVEALYYSRPSGEDGTGEYVEVSEPMPGDRIDFDLTLPEGEWANLVSDNDSVAFDEMQVRQSGHVTGSVVGDEIRWRIEFVSEAAGVTESIDLSR